ncbi:Type 1 glutamine amidotransferase-like domain-containing protein [Salininema proteolyticum]|uniref:Type 1 glutamine amidotransferase-like domain-containing protein n=1 Tax=Salininema proteolyticum TaxID=1607685 RepID=A0ABV8TWL0_9ACTN
MAPPAPEPTVITLGGGFGIDEDTLLDDFALARTGKDRPKVCFLATASGDAALYYERFDAAMAKHDCEPSHLKLFARDSTDPREHLLSQDVIYVGGGNTANLLAVWRVHGIDAIMREAYEAGIVLCGISAGSNCWFEASSTDSFGDFRSLPDGLGLLEGSFCPHYNTEPERQKLYSEAIRAGEIPPGLALDDGALAVFTDGKLTEVRTRRTDSEGPTLYSVDGDGVEPHAALPFSS